MNSLRSQRLSSAPRSRAAHLRRAGVTLLETLTVVAVLAGALAIAAVNLRPLGDPLGAASDAVAATLRQTRARAMTTTSAYRVLRTPEGLAVESARRCDATDWALDPAVATALPPGSTVVASADGTELTANAPLACFGPRGYAERATSLVVVHGERSRTLELYLGGAVEVEP